MNTDGEYALEIAREVTEAVRPVYLEGFRQDWDKAGGLGNTAFIDAVADGVADIAAQGITML